jgi:hypothetical protein
MPRVPTFEDVASALVDLYVCAEENGGSVDFEGLDLIHEMALAALGTDAERIQAEARAILAADDPRPF